MTFMALVVDGVVVGIATGDSQGEPIPTGTAVGIGWRFEDGRFLEPVEIPLSPEQLAAIERKWRDEEVSSTEWLVTRHRDELDLRRDTTLSDEQFGEVLLYRQELRDWPLSPDFPIAERRPVRPAWAVGLSLE